MTEIRVPLSAHDTSALSWALAEIGDRPSRVPEDDSGDPLAVLLAAGYDRFAIMKACKSMFKRIQADTIAEPLTELQKDILRVSVENSSWLKPIIQFGPSSLTLAQAQKVLRDLAAKLQTIGVEINHIPQD